MFTDDELLTILIAIESSTLALSRGAIDAATSEKIRNMAILGSKVKTLLKRGEQPC